MRQVSKLFGQTATPSTFAPTENLQGYPAWLQGEENQYVQCLMTNTFGNTYYVSTKDLVKEASALHESMVSKDPEFVGKALSYARNKGFMRSQPIFGLVKLYTHTPKDEADRLVRNRIFSETFSQVIRTPNDLSDFTTMLKQVTGSSAGGRRLKRVVGTWLQEKVGEYWAIKYGSEGKGTESLVWLIRNFHPNHTPVLRWLRAKKKDFEVDLSELPQIRAFEALKVAVTDEEKIQAITEGRLPHEVVTPFVGDSERVWGALVPQMPIMALMRNLATLERHKALEGQRQVIEKVFGNPDIIQKSKIFPFRFLKAAEKVQSAWAKDALREAVELSFGNLPEIEGKTAVFLDRSGSMSGDFLQTSAIFAICIMKKANLNGRFMTFDNELEEIAVSKRDSILSQADRIRARGMTNTALPMESLLRDRDKVENIVLITDGQQNEGRPFADVFNEYRQKVSPNVRLFIVDVSPYGTSLMKTEKNVYHIFGWSDQVLQFISLATQGWSKVSDAIKEGVV